MAAEDLVQIVMLKSVDFANKGELIWAEPPLAAGLTEAGLARVVQGADDGSGSADNAEPAAGDSSSRKGKRAGSAEDR